MTVDLSQYLDQEVEVTYENGCRRIGKVKKVPKVGLNTVEYSLRWHSDLGGASYTKDGFYWSNKSPFSLNIVKIKPIKMKKYEQLENQIKELQAEVERLKKEEEKTQDVYDRCTCEENLCCCAICLYILIETSKQR